MVYTSWYHPVEGRHFRPSVGHFRRRNAQDNLFFFPIVPLFVLLFLSPSNVLPGDALYFKRDWSVPDGVVMATRYVPLLPWILLPGSLRVLGVMRASCKWLRSRGSRIFATTIS